MVWEKRQRIELLKVLVTATPDGENKEKYYKELVGELLPIVKIQEQESLEKMHKQLEGETSKAYKVFAKDNSRTNKKLVRKKIPYKKSE